MVCHIGVVASLAVCEFVNLVTDMAPKSKSIYPTTTAGARSSTTIGILIKLYGRMSQVHIIVAVYSR